MELTKTELRQVFKHELILLEDTREQKTHISEYFIKHGIGVARWRLKQGDYSFLIMPNKLMGNSEPIFAGQDFLIERKSGPIERGGGYQELWGNLLKGHKQFKDEFLRMQEVDYIFLLIENAIHESCINKVPTQKTPVSVFRKIYDKFLLNRNEERLELGFRPIEVVFSNLENSGERVMLLIFDYLLKKYGKVKF